MFQTTNQIRTPSILNLTSIAMSIHAIAPAMRFSRVSTTIHTTKTSTVQLVMGIPGIPRIPLAGWFSSWNI